METSSFYFDLPPELIAQYPPEIRGTSRLMVLNRQKMSFTHNNMKNLTELISPDTLLICNNSRVRKARLFGRNIETGGKVEFIFLNSESNGKWIVMTSKLKKQRKGKKFLFPENIKAEIIEVLEEGKRMIRTEPPVLENYLERHGHIPLPPYIKREDTLQDTERYQTVYSKDTGSVASPTAGLHITDEMLAQLESKGVKTAFITLHVGLGTFLPIRTPQIEKHRMYEEAFFVSQKTAELIREAIENRKKILAAGTTVVRAVESAFKNGKIKTGWQKTSLFICPGYRFRIINQLLTNFHTPCSSLLVMVSAFAGKDFIMRAYSEAIKKKYSFYSYGDAMLIL
jgi:S-adenosylmethionine:tRNA ribosyltransferase-isomerase